MSRALLLVAAVIVVADEDRWDVRKPGSATWLNDLINPNIKQVEYAVRGPILMRALELKEKLQQPHHALAFDEIIFCNIGNPQALGQEPIEFYRQVLSSVLYPDTVTQYPLDVQARVKTILHNTASGSIGAYTHSQGLQVIRQSVANFITKRDNYAAYAKDVYLTNGASSGVKALSTLLIHQPNHALLVPIPQYPLYTATLSSLGGQAVGYYLDESTGWSVDTDAVEKSIEDAKRKGIEVRGIVIINPGNPTGSVLDSASISRLIKIAAKHRLVIMADEVYQVNIYSPDQQFTSFKKVLRDLEQFGLVEEGIVPLVSFHSTSKGLIGECGLRGGYFEIVNFPQEFKDVLYKIASVSLCPNTVGQVATELMVNPPKPSDPSYARFKQQQDDLFSSMRERADLISKGLNAIPGMSLQPVRGAMYAFPRIELPPGIEHAAQAAGFRADEFYCMRLLEATGIVTVPGSGFRQEQGTYHFRVTLLPPREKIEMVVEKIKEFHLGILARYGSYDYRSEGGSRWGDPGVKPEL